MAGSTMFAPRRDDKTVFQKLLALNPLIILLTIAVAGVGFAMLYSVAGGSWDPWASRQFMRFLVGFSITIIIAVLDIRIWMAMAYPAWVLGLLMLIAVELVGSVGMGGQRWLDLYVMRIQPSELMKIASDNHNGEANKKAHELTRCPRVPTSPSNRI